MRLLSIIECMHLIIWLSISVRMNQASFVTVSDSIFILQLQNTRFLISCIKMDIIWIILVDNEKKKKKKYMNNSWEDPTCMLLHHHFYSIHVHSILPHRSTDIMFNSLMPARDWTLTPYRVRVWCLIFRIDRLLYNTAGDSAASLWRSLPIYRLNRQIYLPNLKGNFDNTRFGVQIFFFGVVDVKSVQAIMTDFILIFCFLALV